MVVYRQSTQQLHCFENSFTSLAPSMVLWNKITPITSMPILIAINYLKMNKEKLKIFLKRVKCIKAKLNPKILLRMQFCFKIGL